MCDISPLSFAKWRCICSQVLRDWDSELVYFKCFRVVEIVTPYASFSWLFGSRKKYMQCISRFAESLFTRSKALRETYFPHKSQFWLSILCPYFHRRVFLICCIGYCNSIHSILHFISKYIMTFFVSYLYSLFLSLFSPGDEKVESFLRA